jgi:hypothetical protein
VVCLFVFFFSVHFTEWKRTIFFCVFYTVGWNIPQLGFLRVLQFPSPIQAWIQDFTLGAHFLARDLGIGWGASLPKLLGIRKYRSSFLNQNWLKLYHVRHDASHRRYVHWSMIFYSWRKALLRLQYEELQSKAFACCRKICVILFNAHYPISLRLKEKELIRMFEIVLGRGKWTCLKQNGKEQVKNIHNLTPNAWLSENCDVCFTYLKSSDCQSSNAILFSFFFFSFF